MSNRLLTHQEAQLIYQQWVDEINKEFKKAGIPTNKAAALKKKATEHTPKVQRG